jgi:chemotaxis signal transduction protein
MRVGQVFPVAEIAPLPNAPAMVRGTVDIHGDLVPVVDFGVRTSSEWTPLHLEQQFLLVDVPGGRRVLLADEVEGVRPLGDGTITDAGLIDVDDVLT